MSRRVLSILALILLLAPTAARAEDDFTLYELLDPATHSFAITYDVTASRAGAEFYLNGIRRGSIVSDERVIDRATGLDLEWEVITGAEAKAQGLVSSRAQDDSEYLKVHLAQPVAEGGEARLRIIKTYTDAASYFTEGDRIVFDRGLGIRANSVVLPPGYELVASAVPSIVSTLADGRVKASFLNDRDDTLPVRIEGRRIATMGGEM